MGQGVVLVIAFILDLLNGVLGFLGSLLPLDPFADFLQVTQGMRMGIQWLNWFFPVREAATFMMVWIGLMVAVRSAQYLLMTTYDFTKIGAK